MQKLKLAVISTYPFRESGIAKFTKDLISTDNIKNIFSKVHVFTAAIEPSEKLIKIDFNFCDTYQLNKLADVINKDYQMLSIQWDDGYVWKCKSAEIGYMNLFLFLKSIKVPVLITLHHGFDKKWFYTKLFCLMRSLPNVYFISQYSNQYGYIKKILKNDSNILLIPHGYPDNLRNHHQYSNRKSNEIILTTLGFFGGWKNQLTMIRLVSSVIKSGIPIKYYVLGSDVYGKDYFRECVDVVRTNHMAKNIFVKNMWLDNASFAKYLRRTDIYVSYNNATVIGSNPSGTMTYALGLGKPVVCCATDFTTSKEMSNLLFVAKNDNDFINILIKLTGDKKYRENISSKIYTGTTKWTWSKISEKYAENMKKILANGGRGSYLDGTDNKFQIWTLYKLLSFVANMNVLWK